MLVEAYEDFYKLFERDMGDRSGTVGASEIGLCARQTFWYKNHGTKKGVKMDPDFKHDWGARIRGTIMEFAFWVPALRRKYQNNLLFAGTEQEKLVSGYLSATPDGLLVNQPYDALRHLGVKNIKSDCITVECKTIDPRTNLVEAKETNIYQVNTQMGLFRELTQYQPEYSCLSYTDASFWSDVEEFAIQFNPIMYGAAKDRAEEIITARNGTQLLPEGWITGGKECSFCPFTEACGIERRGVPYGSKQANPQFAAEIEDMAKEYNSIALSIKKREVVLKTMEVQIKQRLREKKVRRIPNVVNWYDVAAPHRYDNKEIRQAFVEMGGDPEDFAKDGQPSDRLVIAATPAASRVVKAKRKPAKAKVKATAKSKKGKRNVKKQRAKRKVRS